MKKSTRMMLMNAGNRGGDSRNGDRRDYERARDNYDAEDKFRDRRGREHYDNGRYAPMRGEGDYWVDGRFRDRDGREHYDNGRYAPMRSEYGDGAQMHYMPTPYVPPVYQDNRYRGERDYGRERSNHPMNKIGFALEGEMDKLPPREFDRDYRMDEMAYRKGGERMSGYGAGTGYIPFTREIAEEWTSHMENEDGSKGPHWTMEQTKQVMAQRGIDCDPLEFWVAINMIYSDYCKAAKKANANTLDFYADMAKAFLDDKDAPEDKLARYYYYIADAKE